jgi:hypothetical protein
VVFKIIEIKNTQKKVSKNTQDKTNVMCIMCHKIIDVFFYAKNHANPNDHKSRDILKSFDQPCVAA